MTGPPHSEQTLKCPLETGRIGQLARLGVGVARFGWAQLLGDALMVHCFRRQLLDHPSHLVKQRRQSLPFFAKLRVLTVARKKRSETIPSDAAQPMREETLRSWSLLRLLYRELTSQVCALKLKWERCNLMILNDCCGIFKNENRPAIRAVVTDRPTRRVALWYLNYATNIQATHFPPNGHPQTNTFRIVIPQRMLCISSNRTAPDNSNCPSLANLW